jgi:hypothetical protein
MLPSPTLAFTIPSIHDDIELQCKIYHPTCLAPTNISQYVPWKKRAAIIAHPYAPLGGCQDDPVVGLLACACLKEGFVVGTFNFRYTLYILVEKNSTNGLFFQRSRKWENNMARERRAE